MALGIREFERLVKKICPRWYVKGGPISKVSVPRASDSLAGGRFSTVLRPVEVWEVPYTQGEGFTGDSLVYVMGSTYDLEQEGRWDYPSLKDLNWLKEAHWNRVRAQQAAVFRRMLFNRVEQTHIDLARHKHDTIEYAKEARRQFAEAASKMGLMKHALKRL